MIRSRNWTALAALIPIAVTLAFPAPARADWNSGVGRTEVRTSLAPDVGPTEANPLWQGSRPSLVAQQGIAAGNLLVLNRIESFTIPTGDWIVAQDLATGSEKWRVQLPFANPDEWRSRATAFRDGHIYATRSGGAANPGYLYALDPADGAIIWRSIDRIQESTTESAAFAPNGDLIIGNFTEVLRINKDTGTTVWRASRMNPTDDGGSAVVFGGHVYTWEASGQGPKVTVFNLATGTRLYSSAALSAGLIQQIGLMIGPDGTIYAPRSMNNPATDYFVALTDTGTALVEKWRYPMGYTPFASFGVGPDGTLYTYSRSNELVRLDPATGGVLNTSVVIGVDFPLMPRIGIDANGTIFLTNGGFSHGTLYSFNADLTFRWAVNIPSVNLGGPVIGQGGVLVVCGTGTDVRAFRTTDSAGIEVAGAPESEIVLDQNTPNPFQAETSIGFRLPYASQVTLALYDATGTLVRRLIDGEMRPAGRASAIWDGRNERGDRVAAGVYFYRLDCGNEKRSRRMLLTR
jgi:outer membrane protein assembly factor BamB